MKIRIGTSGWNFPHWRGKLYPEGMPSKSWLGIYSTRFDAVELNYSFYRWPTRDNIKNWYGKTPGDFRFMMKIPRKITHYMKLKNAGKKAGDFYRLASGMKDKLGCLLHQLPPLFERNDENVARLEIFLESIDRGKRNVFEFRNKGWWNKDIYRMLKKAGAGFVSVDGLGLPDDVIVTAPFAYFRFHGDNYETRYDDSQIDQLAERISGIKAEEAFVFFNNDVNGYAVENAIMLKERIDGKGTGEQGVHAKQGSKDIMASRPFSEK